MYKYEFEKQNRIPYNEFSEICTGDLPDADLMYHYWIQPQWKKEREAWEKKIKNMKSF